MSRRHKTFTGGRSIEDFEPVEFDLNDKSFVCKPAIQGAALLDFVSRSDAENGAAAAAALYDFFKQVMSEDEYTRFNDYLNNPKVIIEMEVIGEIAGWLVEEYTSRPTLQSSSSEDGQSSSGPTSMDRAS